MSERVNLLPVDAAGVTILVDNSGAINVLRHAQHLMSVDRIHAFVGGFHLTGGIFEPIIPPHRRRADRYRAYDYSAWTLYRLEGNS